MLDEGKLIGLLERAVVALEARSREPAIIVIPVTTPGMTGENMQRFATELAKLFRQAMGYEEPEPVEKTDGD